MLIQKCISMAFLDGIVVKIKDLGEDDEIEEDIFTNGQI